jgi:hypothetical protein
VDLQAKLKPGKNTIEIVVVDAFGNVLACEAGQGDAGVIPGSRRGLP